MFQECGHSPRESVPVHAQFPTNDFSREANCKAEDRKTGEQFVGKPTLESIHESLLCQRAGFSLQFIMLVLLVSFTLPSLFTAGKLS
ncbi:hypothetical protein CDAR_227951 [Caerostris darwini]|uniref:Uncharacterized protein n=1 Tax=Caerostris darwini TaxID=1538125 RepID=A0AAV4VDD0_9ARAC|nr:hypothetical protein CDAR_227951 [Caerostris darwini]